MNAVKSSAYFVGKAILILRTEADPKIGLTELAARAGCSRSHISMVERGQANPTFDLVERLAGALGCTMDEFVVRYSALRARAAKKEKEDATSCSR